MRVDFRLTTVTVPSQRVDRPPLRLGPIELTIFQPLEMEHSRLLMDFMLDKVRDVGKMTSRSGKIWNQVMYVQKQPDDPVLTEINDIQQRCSADRLARTRDKKQVYNDRLMLLESSRALYVTSALLFPVPRVAGRLCTR